MGELGWTFAIILVFTLIGGFFAASEVALVSLRESQINQLTARITANVKAGNTAVAGELALRLQTVKGELARNKEQYAIAEKTYQTSVKQVSLAQTEFNRKMEALKSKLNQAKINEALASATAASANMSFKVGDLGDTIGRIDEVVTERAAKAEGKIRATSDLVNAQGAEIQVKEEEQKALADQALAEFMASQGMAVPTIVWWPVVSHWV